MNAAPDSSADAIRAATGQARERMRAMLIGGGGGRAACGELSRCYDDIVRELWNRALAALPARSADGRGMALLATGGWGRGEVCPHSDIDFTVLARDADHPAARAVADALLYPLWDAGIKVGHAVREPRELAKLAQDDLATATALLDARLLAGDPDRADALLVSVRRAIAPGGHANAFVDRLADERRRRHDKFGDSLYLLEPNLKHGIGGLRDLATALWAIKARWWFTHGSGQALRDLVMAGLISTRQAQVLSTARDFLLALRALTHLTTGRATDQLGFEVQEAIGPALYPDAGPDESGPAAARPAVAPAVEALMRQYYLHARGVVRVADRMLEASRTPPRRKPRIARIDASFVSWNGALAARDPRRFRDRPAEMLRLFRVALERRLPIYGHTLELVEETVAARRDALAGDREAARHFLDALIDPRDCGKPPLLEQMHQVGLVGAVIPEFAPCTGRVQHDLYHVYTVDQHQLLAVAMLKRLARGELAAEFPDATGAIARVTRPAPLHLGTLLHDVGKPLGKGHSEKGARIAQAVARRFEMPAPEAELAGFLVRHHLTMSVLSQRRDLSDPEVIARFARRILDCGADAGGAVISAEERLTQLYLLTLCDTAMTAPGNLSAWKHQLLRELYLRARDALRGGSRVREAAIARDAAGARSRVVELLMRDVVGRGEGGEGGEAAGGGAGEGAGEGARELRAEIERWVDGIDERFFAALSPRQLARLVGLGWQRQRAGTPVALAVSHFPLKGHSELAVVADDTPGLLAAIAGALTANRIDVLGAVLGPRPADAPGAGQVALDLFYVRDPYGQAIPADDPRWARLRADLVSVLADARGAGEASRALVARRIRPPGLPPKFTPGVPTRVEVHNDASTEATVVEVFTRDRPGVLYAITRTLSELGLDIHLAKVHTAGEEVADVFYVTRGEPRRKLTAPGEVEQITGALAAALAELPDPRPRRLRTDLPLQIASSRPREERR